MEKIWHQNQFHWKGLKFVECITYKQQWYNRKAIRTIIIVHEVYSFFSSCIKNSSKFRFYRCAVIKQSRIFSGNHAMLRFKFSLHNWRCTLLCIALPVVVVVVVVLMKAMKELTDNDDDDDVDDGKAKL